ncbi:MAG TPA: hypothetical protein DCR30_07245 [Afipia sp.]|nr:hypothetical protein [Afipia sp.]
MFPITISRTWRALVSLAAMIVVMLAWPLVAQHVTPSKPFLEKNAFYLRSAGFRIQLANDAAGQRALKAFPPHRFVIHRAGGTPRYVYADPGVCNCIFSGSLDNYKSYLDILRQPLPGVDDVSPDYKTQASALLLEQPIDFGMTGSDDSLVDYFRDYL